jgi:hypothetical protein
MQEAKEGLNGRKNGYQLAIHPSFVIMFILKIST